MYEPGPFPCSLPPNPACAVKRTGLSSDLCRVRDRVRVDVFVARRADDERLAPHFRHEGRPRGLARPGFPELAEPGDLVDCHRGAALAQLAHRLRSRWISSLRGVMNGTGRGR